MKPFIFLIMFLCPNYVWGSNYLSEIPLDIQTTYFHFYYKQNEEKVAELARFADGLIKAINKDFFTAEFDYPMAIVPVCMVVHPDLWRPTDLATDMA